MILCSCLLSEKLAFVLFIINADILFSLSIGLVEPSKFIIVAFLVAF